ncbi:MAG: TonB-dependent receptor [Acidobacteria bacterium]|nr:TonB-dependent receptor [Acidobacteriota bacterium]
MPRALHQHCKRILLALLFSAALQAQVHGLIQDGRTGEALSKARVTARDQSVASDAQGRFSITATTGDELRVSLVGYRTLRVVVSDSARELELVLTPDGLSQTDSVEVKEGPFDARYSSSPSERTLSSAELRNLTGVIANDPLRAVQSLPGVASSNDFTASMSIRGADFRRVGIYLDGVLMNNPLHSTQGQQASGSLSMLNTDVVETVTLHAAAPPVSYMDRNAAALEMTIREGTDKGLAWRVNGGVAGASALAEGPWRKGTWLVSVRKSYLQYLLQKARAIDTLAFGFFDTQAKLGYNPTRRQHVTLALFDGVSDLDRSNARATLGANAILNGTYHMTNVQLGHRWTPGERILVTNKLSWLRERSENVNVLQLPLTRAGYREWIANSGLEWKLLRAGSSFRQILDDGFEARYVFNPVSVRRRDLWDASALRAGGYVEQGFASRRLSGTLGTRIDGTTARQPRTFSPHAGLRMRLSNSTQWIASWSQAAQYTPLSALTIANLGNSALLPSRAIHAVTGIEQALNPTTRVRVEAYYRADRDLPAQPLADIRQLANGQVLFPPAAARFENSLRGVARGIEIFLQKRSANRWNGWVSYGWSRARMRDGITGAHYDADTDQRHTVNGYASYRWSASVNLSARYSYGSNFPVPGFFSLRNGQYFLSTQRNTVRLPQYSRADFRVNKQFERKKWRGVLFLEVMNLFNTDNRTFDSYNGYNVRTGQANVSLLRLFPIVPAAGWMMDWGNR